MLGAPISYRSAQILNFVKSRGRASMPQLRAANLVDDFSTIYKLIQNDMLCAVSLSTPRDYTVTKKGLKALARIETMVRVAPVTKQVEKPANVTPSRTIWNSTSREPYRTGDGRARVGLAMTGV